MIEAHGATITVTNEEIKIAPTVLAASLRGLSGDASIDVASVDNVALVEGDAWDSSFVSITTSAGTTTIEFAPGAIARATELKNAIGAAQQGTAPSEESQAEIPGFNFVGFDVETANSQWGSICQIGVVKVLNGRETERASWLCTPPEPFSSFDPFNVRIHGITSDDVANQPSFQERLAEFRDFVGELPIVAHNAQFDTTALRDASVASGEPIPHLLFACTLAQSRASSLKVDNHKLPTVAAELGVELSHHHDAAADASAAAQIMVEFARRAGHSGSLMEFIHASGFTLGVIEDKRIVPVLKDRSGASRALQASQLARIEAGESVPAAQLSPAPEVSGAGTDQPSRRGPAPWQSVSTPDEIPEPNLAASPSHPLYGQNVTLTGEFEPFDKGTLWHGIANAGGQVAKNVTKKTTILVTGVWATMTSKEKRARELMEKGQNIEIWSEEKLLGVLGLDEQPPF
ncbi:exonuclease domain-containing protein [Corynebacterium lubricantis]|uniref:exonuclease domain-containing protein n=1 Tax=Corynebacterium lubricantis TaxID=541095 RepID=UPI00035E7DEB|nr:exonuclease domain-containing protein [Corynebacterium lubricantis]